MSYQELLYKEYFNPYPDVQIVPRFDFDGEVESVDVIIDNLHDAWSCEEFIYNDWGDTRVKEKRFKLHRRVALRELTPGLYDENGNPIRRKKSK